MGPCQRDTLVNLEHPSDIEEAMSRLQECWLQLISKRTIPEEALRPHIVNSWEHCLRLNVDPQTHNPSFLDSVQLKPHLEARRGMYRGI
jgi:transcriptional regulator of acetoin/glycerol metabolism